MTISATLEAVKPLTVSVTEFKAKCLSLLDDIAEGGGTITVTKRGRPVAIVRPARRDTWKSPEGAFAGKIAIGDDLFETDTSSLWEVVRRLPEARR
jgi:prevent-host-death family protein